MTLVETVAVVCGLACVALLIRRSIWSWPVGLVQVLLYIWIFWHARLYSDVLLHVVYVVLQLYGWAVWVRGNARADSDEMPIRVLRVHGLLVAALVTAGGTVALGQLMSLTDAALPMADAFTTVASLTAQVLLARKVLQNWLFWIGVDLVAIPVYLSRELYLTAGLYGVFLALAITGWLAWRQAVRQGRALEQPSADAFLASSSHPTAVTSTSSTSPATTSIT